MPAAVDTRSAKPDAEQSPPRHLRLDIQALRAIAVALVVVYHLNAQWMPGGYIGVDVFFVISGFLITSHLIREAMRHGKVKLGAFWAARARRILPASLLTIGVTVGLTLFFAPVTQFETLRRQALASIFYVQNWVLARDAVDYSAAENDATPFQHFWTLSVEEQFYLFWPLLVLVGVWIVARKTATAGLALNERSFRAALTVLFGVVVLASLVYSILKVARGDLEAYFITTTRIWELGAGSMLAVVGGLRLSTAGRNLLTYLGLAAIVVSAFVLSDETPFPGLAAVPVIAGTIAVILAGTPDRDGRLAPLVRADPWAAASNFTVAQWIGDRSYSLYLWHFPVIILWPMIVKHPASWLDIVGMVVVALVLSDLSYRFIEQPVRKAPFFAQSTRNSLIAALLALLAIAGTTWLYPLRAEQATASWKELATETKALPELGAASIVDGHLEPFPSGTITMMPSPADAQKNTPKGFRGKRCVAPQLADVIPECISGDEKSDVSIALVGDSHARMYAGAIAEAAKKNGWRLRTYLKVSCPFTPTPKVLETRGSLVCTEPNAAVLDELLADPPDLVVTTWRFSTNFTADGDPDAAAAAGFASYWNTLEDAGIGVLVLRDVPEHQQDVPACVAAHYTDPEACTTPRDDSSLLGSAVLEQAIALAPRTRVADFTDLLCDQSSCKAVIGNVLAYRDKHHLTAVYARTMIPQLAEAIDAALPSGAR